MGNSITMRQRKASVKKLIASTFAPTRRPREVLELIHGSLAVNPPKPKPLIAPKQFAALLKGWRRKHCLTQAQACAALGLPNDQALISDWENCKATPRGKRLREMIAALKQPPAGGPGSHRWFVARANEFGQRLRAWRQERGLRQIDACAVLGLPPDHALISDWERSKGSPCPERIERLLAIIQEVQP